MYNIFTIQTSVDDHLALEWSTNKQGGEVISTVGY